MPLLAVLSLQPVLTLCYKPLPKNFCILNQAEICLYPSQFDTLYPGGNITLSVHLPHASPCIKHRYVPLLELVFLTCDTHFLLCIITFIFMKKQKKTGGKGVLSCISSSRVTFEQSIKLFKSIHHHNFGISMALGS